MLELVGWNQFSYLSVHGRANLSASDVGTCHEPERVQECNGAHLCSVWCLYGARWLRSRVLCVCVVLYAVLVQLECNFEHRQLDHAIFGLHPSYVICAPVVKAFPGQPVCP